MTSNTHYQTKEEKIFDYSTKSNADVLKILEGAKGRLAENAGNESALRVFASAQSEALKRGLLHPRTKMKIKRWSAVEVADLLSPFADLAKSVMNNARLPGRGMTHAGGLKLKGEMEINSYTAIRANGVDVVLAAYAERKNDIPYFILRERLSPNDKEMTETGRFTISNLLEEALPRWEALTRLAQGDRD
jgi:hypothetical protein